MNEYYPSITLNAPMLATKDPKGVDVDSLLKGRKFNRPDTNQEFNMFPEIPEYDQEDVKELEEYCKKRGIIGVNFGKMSPRQTLAMLKGKTEGKYIPTTKKGLIYG